MAYLWRRWEGSPTRFGDAAVLGFLVVQCLDGVLTYVAVSMWGLGIEGNPLISAIVAMTGLAVGLTVAKLVAVTFGIALHLRRVHSLVALLTALYLAVAILPWAAVFLTH